MSLLEKFLTIIILIPSKWFLKWLKRFFIFYFSFMLIYLSFDRLYNEEKNFKQSFWRYLNLIFDGTKYSEDFTYKKFRNLKIGMSEMAVEDIIGSPIEKNCYQGTCFWSYTIRHEINFGPYDIKNVELKNSFVTHIEDEYHLD